VVRRRHADRLRGRQGRQAAGGAVSAGQLRERQVLPDDRVHIRKLFQRLHRYNQPVAYSFNKSVYTSNGYAVLQPDITYEVNDPGMSAVWSVLPALDAAIATGVVDEARVGLQGHSWGGYQASFLITQTNRFKAAAAGAPLTNLVSMYSSIYWNTGGSNQAIFEQPGAVPGRLLGQHRRVHA